MNKLEVNLIIIAMDEEFDCLIEALDNQYQIIGGEDQHYLFTRHNENFLAVKGKIGKVNTSFYLGKLSQIYQIKKIYNLGTSGGVDPQVKIGDVVIAERVRYYDVDVTGFNYPMGQVPGSPLDYLCDKLVLEKRVVGDGFTIHKGLIASGDSFITKNNFSHFPLEEIRPLAVEMESGAVSQCADKLNVPLIVIRSISDLVLKEGNSEAFDNNLIKASQNCVKVLLQLI